MDQNSKKHNTLKKKRSDHALTKRDLVLQISESTLLPQIQVQEVVQATLDGIVAALANGQHVEFREFGVFEMTERKARTGRNPNNPSEPIHIPPCRTVKFKPGKLMRDISGCPSRPL
ncbi:MAG: integration host factor subunit beta [Lentisphaerae bacterium]|jgi:nucleoid DNA-binding protein|nr:integration host factor subunit beta [Lentisphaerota bacterium]